MDRALAARLIAAQFPRVPVDALEHLGEGWDNDVWRAGDLVFRFPRRTVAVALLETEGRALPMFAGTLPVRIPEPVCFGKPSAEFGFPFLGYHYLPGSSGDCLDLDDAERHALAAPLGRFLRVLHAVEPERAAAAGVPVDRFRADVPRYVKLMEDRLAPLTAHLAPAALDGARALAAAAAALPELGPERRVVHGDLYLRHLMFDESRRWTAVIDWGDLSLAHPLADVIIAYTALPRSARAAVFESYGNVSADDRLRARFIGLVRHGLTLLAYALDRQDAPLAAEARRAVAHALDPEL